MSVDDKQITLNQGPQFDVGDTFVDEHNRLSHRIRRWIRRLWLPVIIIGVLLKMLLDPAFMAAVIPLFSGALMVVLFMLIFLSQFIILFWFLGRTRTYTIMPDSGVEGVSFDDYRGQPEILEQAEQIVTLLRGVRAFEGAGGEPLTGLLLEGPPGTGKTWLAQAISTEAGVPFYYMDASGLQSMFFGVGPMKVMGLFRKARKMAKRYGASVIFLDEIDAVGSRGGVASVNGNDDDSMFGGSGMGGMGILSTMLIEMDGFSQEHGWRARLRAWMYKTFLRRKPPKPEKRVLVIGATNRMSALDKALLRPGRFDKKIRVDVPDMEGRREIFDYYLEKYTHDESVDTLILASETPGYTPADIKYLLNEALRYAFFDGRNALTYHDFMRAKPEHEMGLRAPLKHISPEARLLLAYHFAGHAVAIRLFLPHHRISRVTIVRQGRTFGHVSHYSAQESFQGLGLQTKTELLNRVRSALAGRAAEIEFCGADNQTRLFEDDLYVRYGVVDILRMMASAGMFETMGANMGLVFNMFSGVSQRLTPEQARGIEEVYQQVLQETRQALRDHADVVTALADLLSEKDELLADELRDFFEAHGFETPEITIVRDGREYRIFDDVEKPALSAESGTD